MGEVDPLRRIETMWHLSVAELLGIHRWMMIPSSENRPPTRTGGKDMVLKKAGGQLESLASAVCSNDAVLNGSTLVPLSSALSTESH